MKWEPISSKVNFLPSGLSDDKLVGRRWMRVSGLWLNHTRFYYNIIMLELFVLFVNHVYSMYTVWTRIYVLQYTCMLR